jgi:predicted DNA-binding transcriptional regulator AlpA
MTTTQLNYDRSKLLDEHDVAELLGLSSKWVQQARHKGIGPRFIKLGSAINAPVRYSREDVLIWIAAHAVDPRSAK